MTRLVARLFLVVLLASSVGCTAWGKPKPKSGPSDGCCLKNAQLTSFQTMLDTSPPPSAAEPQRFEVMRSQERLDAVWPELFGPNPPPNPVPSIDFDSESVIVYSMGTQPNGCYTAERLLPCAPKVTPFNAPSPTTPNRNLIPVSPHVHRFISSRLLDSGHEMVYSFSQTPILDQELRQRAGPWRRR